MLQGFVVLLAFQLLGEVIHVASGLPVPGPVLGMLGLLAMLIARGEVSAEVKGAASGLLRHLSLLFVPAGVGVMVHRKLLAAEWPTLLLVLIASTAIALVVTGWTMQLMQRICAERGQ